MSFFEKLFGGNKPEESKTPQGPKVGEDVEKAAREAESKQVDIEDLASAEGTDLRNKISYYTEQFVNDFLDNLKKEDPLAANLMEQGKIGMSDFKKSLKDQIHRTLPTRVEGLKKGWTSEDEFKQGLNKVADKIVASFKEKA